MSRAWNTLWVFFFKLSPCECRYSRLSLFSELVEHGLVALVVGYMDIPEQTEGRAVLESRLVHLLVDLDRIARDSTISALRLDR